MYASLHIGTFVEVIALRRVRRRSMPSGPKHHSHHASIGARHVEACPQFNEV
jgi:hypothetical protein